MLDEATPVPTPQGVKRRKWRQLLRPAGWIIGALAIGLMAMQLHASMAEIGEITIAPLPALAALGLGCASLFSYAVLWQRNLGQLGEQISLRAAVRAWFLSQLARYVPGNIWHLFGRAYLAQQQGVRMQPLALSLVLELLQTITAALLLAAALLPLWPMPLWAQPWLLLALPALAIYGYPPLLDRPLRWMGRRAGTALAGRPLRSRDMLRLLPGYLLTWVLYGSGLYLLGRAIYPLPLSALPGISASFAIAWVIGFLSLITPSGIGVREGVLTLLLTTMMPQPVALLLALAARVWLTVAELCTLAVALLVSRHHEDVGDQPRKDNSSHDTP